MFFLGILEIAKLDKCNKFKVSTFDTEPYTRDDMFQDLFYQSLFNFAGLLCDLLWSDPDKDVTGWGENDRGVSFTFGADVVSKFLNRHDLDLICRAHQVSD